MAKYRVKPGYSFGAYSTFKEGMIVELLEIDAQPFLDKLELVPDEVPAVPEPEAVADPKFAPPSLDMDMPEAPEMPDENAEVVVKSSAVRRAGKSKG
jgi:hypothetical protein